MGECPVECATWAKEMMGYCLCTPKDAISLAVGLVSVVSWGVAEIPQIITNFKTHSTDGLSFLFLFTWIIGDFFNLFGCLLEPATLPTQFYMALLYTITTLTLTLQSVYYGYICPRLKFNRQFQNGKSEETESARPYGMDDNHIKEKLVNGSYGHIPISSMHMSDTNMSSPIPLPALPRSHSAGHDSYYMSARSLSTSHTPTSSFLAPRRSSLEDIEGSIETPLLNEPSPTRPDQPLRKKNLLCVVSAVTIILGVLNLTSSRNVSQGLVIEISSNSVGGFRRRKLLKVNRQQKLFSEAGGHGVGTFLGWAMAAIYMGGRLPQICLNIRRGNVEGLNPLMFMFALLGNTTYVASILVNSLEWSKIMPNLPWLVDAGGCALLDTFILLQFIYFRYWRSKLITSSDEE